MKFVLFLLAILAFMAGFVVVFGIAETSIHEIAGFVLFTISAVLISGAVVADAIDALPSKLEKLLMHKNAKELPSTLGRATQPAGPTDQRQLMEQFGIEFDGEKYHFREYRYDKLEDAVSYARRSHA
jgi:hypothetical protein